MPSPQAPVGRRERKKAATRLALSNAAMRLFFERGFDDVTVREIADAADVSTTTLMKHFPTKEALVFDRDDEIERSLIAAVAERPPRTSVLDALRDYVRAREAEGAPEQRAQFMRLVLETPALSEYWRTMWMRHERSLARVLAQDSGRPDGDPWCVVMAHFVLEALALAAFEPQAARMIEVAFAILEQGWQRSDLATRGETKASARRNGPTRSLPRRGSRR